MINPSEVNTLEQAGIGGPMLPNFLVIGAYKCGTTSLHHYLGQHPDIFMAARKEPNFFAFDTRQNTDITVGVQHPALAGAVTDLSEYEALFAGHGGRARVGEVSPEYLVNEWACARIAARIPDAKLIVVLRNPVDRAYSDYLMYVRDGLEHETFERALELQDERSERGELTGYYLSTGHYADQIGRYDETFGPEQLHIALFDDLFGDRNDTLASIFEFLGVDPDVELTPERALNRSGVPDSGAMRIVFDLRRRLGPLLRRVVPDGVKHRLDHAAQSRLVRPEMEPRTRQRLVEEFETDVAWLETRLGRDLSGWRT